MKKQRKKLEEIDVIFDIVENGKIPTNDSRDLISRFANSDCNEKSQNHV